MEKQKKSIYNFANFLSLSRIFVAAPLIVCFENLDNPFYFKYSIIIIAYQINEKDKELLYLQILFRKRT